MRNLRYQNLKQAREAVRQVLRPIWYKYCLKNRTACLEALTALEFDSSQTYYKRTPRYISKKIGFEIDEFLDGVKILSDLGKLIYFDGEVILKNKTERNREFNEHVLKTKKFKINK